MRLDRLAILGGQEFLKQVQEGKFDSILHIAGYENYTDKKNLVCYEKLCQSQKA